MKVSDITGRRNEFIKISMSFGATKSDAPDVVQDFYFKLLQHEQKHGSLDKLVYQPNGELNNGFVCKTIKNIIIDSRKGANKQMIKIMGEQLIEGTATKYHKLIDKINMEQTTGLGDAIETLTKKTGIKRAVSWFSEITGLDCGCEKRKIRLNELFPRSRYVNCFSLQQYKEFSSILISVRTEFKNNLITHPHKLIIARLHSEVFSHKYALPSCSRCGKRYRQWFKDLEKVYYTYLTKPKK